MNAAVQEGPNLRLVYTIVTIFNAIVELSHRKTKGWFLNYPLQKLCSHFAPWLTPLFIIGTCGP